MYARWLPEELAGAAYAEIKERERERERERNTKSEKDSTGFEECPGWKEAKSNPGVGLLVSAPRSLLFSFSLGVWMVSMF